MTDASSSSADTGTDNVVHIPTLASLKGREGETLAVSEWVLVDQERVNLFADATGDHQWIHVDPERAKAGPYGAPIAHGFLTLSLIPELAAKALKFDDVRMSVNYGLNKVRFPAPVPVGSRVRAHIALKSFEEIQGGAQVTMSVTIEREGGDKPVCVAEPVARRYT
jgi:acyl dehydratase